MPINADGVPVAPLDEADHPCDMCGAPGATAVTSRCWMCAACQERGSARATMARMPVLNDPVISAAVASLEDDAPPVFSWLPSPSPRPATYGAAMAALEATEAMLREAMEEIATREARAARWKRAATVQRHEVRYWRNVAARRSRETDYYIATAAARAEERNRHIAMLEEQLRDRCADLEYEYTTRVEVEAACQRLEWDAAEAGALTMSHESRIAAALRHLDAGDLGAARRALEGKP